MTYELLYGDCLEVMAAMDAGSVDAVVTDPPYGLEFMGKEWDKLDGGLPQETVWKGRRGRGASKVDTRPAEETFKDGVARVSFGGKQQGFKRCRECGKRAFSGSPCVCDEPDFVTEYAQRAPSASIRMQRWHEQWALEAYRVLKPSHYLLAFGGTRTWHRLACAIEDAGFEVRDTLMWLYGSGFPKGKSCLKPAWEPIILARKPGPMRELGIEECRIGTEGGGGNGLGSYGYGTGAVANHKFGADTTGTSGRWPANLILECTCDETREGTAKTGTHVGHNCDGSEASNSICGPQYKDVRDRGHADANGKEPVRIHTDPNCPCAMLDGQTGEMSSHGGGTSSTGFWQRDGRRQPIPKGDSGGASRFFKIARRDLPTVDDIAGIDPNFTGDMTTDEYMDWLRDRDDAEPIERFRYVAKASRSERNKGMDGMDAVDCGTMQDDSYKWEHDGKGNKIDLHTRAANHHPTVKPVALMRWLVRLVAQPGDVVLDPFMGSGTTGVACAMEGREFIGIEREAEYIGIARRRIENASAQGRLKV